MMSPIESMIYNAINSPLGLMAECVVIGLVIRAVCIRATKSVKKTTKSVIREFKRPSNEFVLSSAEKEMIKRNRQKNKNEEL